MSNHLVPCQPQPQPEHQRAWTWLIMLLTLFLVYLFVLDRQAEPLALEIPYSEIKALVSEGAVKAVALEANTITAVLREPWPDQPDAFSAFLPPFPGAALLPLLESQGVEATAVARRDLSPLLYPAPWVVLIGVYRWPAAGRPAIPGWRALRRPMRNRQLRRRPRHPPRHRHRPLHGRSMGHGRRVRSRRPPRERRALLPPPAHARPRSFSDAAAIDLLHRAEPVSTQMIETHRSRIAMLVERLEAEEILDAAAIRACLAIDDGVLPLATRGPVLERPAG